MESPAAQLVGMDAAWETDLRVRLGYSDLHVAKSLKAVRAFDRFVTRGERAASQADYTRANILTWATSLIDPDRPGSRKTAQNRVSQLRAYCDFLILRGSLTGENPVAGLRMPSARGRRAGAVHFTAAEVSALIAMAEKRERGKPPLASTFYAVLACTGMRFGESHHQEWKDVDLAHATLTFTLDKARRNDTLPLSRECVAALRIWKRTSTGRYIFPERPSHHTLLKDMEACGVAGADQGVKGQWHRFRKCAVRERAKAGASVRDLKAFARHRDVNQTLNVYDFADVEELRGVAELLPRLNGFLGGGKNVDEKSSMSEVDSRGEPIYSAPVTTKKGLQNAGTLAQPEPDAGARRRIRPRRDRSEQCSRAPATGSGSKPQSEWSRGELPLRLAAIVLRAVADHIEQAGRIAILAFSIWRVCASAIHPEPTGQLAVHHRER